MPRADVDLEVRPWTFWQATLLVGMSLLSLGALSFLAYLLLALVRRSLACARAAGLTLLSLIIGLILCTSTIVPVVVIGAVLLIGTWLGPAVHARRVSRHGLVGPDGDPGPAPEPATFSKPLIGWVTGGLTPDGHLDVNTGDDWTATESAAREVCSNTPLSVTYQRAWLSDWPAERIEGDQRAPGPACYCGLTIGRYHPPGHWTDQHRDRVGHRMQTAALVAVWGRALLTPHHVRAQYGRVLLLTGSTNDHPTRQQRLKHAADHLSASTHLADPDTGPDFDELARTHGTQFGTIADKHTLAQLHRTHGGRRWRKGSPAALDTLHMLATSLPPLRTVNTEVELLISGPAGSTPGTPITIASRYRHLTPILQRVTRRG